VLTIYENSYYFWKCDKNSKCKFLDNCLPNSWIDSYVFFKTSKVDKWMMCKCVINIFINDVPNVMSTN
jgi:hypothetical protein